MKKFMCDFETSTEAWLERDNGVARVWAGCIATIEEQPKVIAVVNDIDKFMEALIKLGNIECFFHNLKFDGEYIINWLFKNGYHYSDNAKQEKSFNCIISDTGQWYSITITHKAYSKRYLRTTIYDSLKKIPLKVSEISKAYNIPEAKGSIDYDLYRPVGYEIQQDELEYITNDCVIVAKALYMQFTQGLEKMTISSDAMFNFKVLLGGQKTFNYVFPKFSLAVDNDIRKAYKGGFVMVNPKYAGKIVSGISFDVNSLYPSVMYGMHGSLPYGHARYFKGKYKPNKHYPLYIQKLSCEFAVKPDMIPTLQLKGNLSFIPTEYVRKSNGVVDLTLTSVDIELMFEHYDVWNIEYVGGYMFREARDIFKEYIDYWSEIKKNSTGGLRQLAKLMLNSLYGKFATNPKRMNKIPYLTADGLKYDTVDGDDGEPVYTALGAFITSRARAYTIRNAQMLYQHWVYSDTDSMYLTGITEQEASKYITIHDKNLGAWKCEHHFTAGKFLRPKTYILDSVEDGLSISCAGMPDNIKETLIKLGNRNAFTAFDYGARFTGKLVPKHVDGGVILASTDFTIMT